MTTSSPREAALYVLGKLCEPRPQRVSKRERMLACALVEFDPDLLRAAADALKNVSAAPAEARELRRYAAILDGSLPAPEKPS